MSAVLSLAKPQRIKASHRRRWKGTTGHRLYIMNNPLSGTDPTGYVSCATTDSCPKVVETTENKGPSTRQSASEKRWASAMDFTGPVGSARPRPSENGAKGQSASKPVGTSSTASRESSGNSTTATADTLGPNAVRVGNGTTIKDTVSAQMRMEMANRYIGAVNEILDRGDGAIFSSPEAAARVFRDLFASMSGYLGLEFGGNVEPVMDYLDNPVKDKFKLADIVSSRSDQFQKKTNYGGSVSVPFSKTAVAWMHTHPDLNFSHKLFSRGEGNDGGDTYFVLARGKNHRQDAYAFYPEGYGRKFDASQKGVMKINYDEFYGNQNKYAPEFR